MGTRTTPAATTTSGRRVLYTAEGACTASGSRIDITAVGTCTITAHQPGDLYWRPAEPVSHTITTTRGTNRISFTVVAPSPTTVGDTLTLRSSTSSGTPPRYEVEGPCTLHAGTLPWPTATATGPGTCTITARHDGDDHWQAAAPVARTTTITPT